MPNLGEYNVLSNTMRLTSGSHSNQVKKVVDLAGEGIISTPRKLARVRGIVLVTLIIHVKTSFLPQDASIITIRQSSFPGGVTTTNAYDTIAYSALDAGKVLSADNTAPEYWRRSNVLNILPKYITGDCDFEFLTSASITAGAFDFYLLWTPITEGSTVELIE